MTRSKTSAPFDEPKKLEPPRIIGVLPDDVPGGDENLLPKDGWLRPLRFELPLWGDLPEQDGDVDKVELHFGGKVVHVKELGYPVNESDYWLEVPPDELKEGVHSAFYRLFPWNSQPSRECIPVNVTIDKTPPRLAADSALLFPPEVSPPPKEIDAFYLAKPENQDQVQAILPEYQSPKVGDVITWYWEEFPDSVNVVDTWTLTEPIGSPLMLPFSGQMLRDRGNGSRYATYRVRDRAGNESVPSANVRLMVNIQPPPLRKHPTVKEAQNGAGSALLDPLFYGVSGVTVVIPRQDDEDKGFKREVYWNGFGELGSHHALQPNPLKPLEFSIPPGAIPANIGAGRIVEIVYTVDTLNGSPETSDPLKLTVKSIATVNFNPPIDCPLAARGTPIKLQRSSVPNEGTPLVLQPWIYQATTQLINIWLTDSNNRREDILIAHPVVKGVNKATLPKPFLEGVVLNSVFAVHVSVSFDGGESYLPFPPQDIQLLR